MSMGKCSPWQSNIDTQNQWFGKGKSLKLYQFSVSMLDFRGVNVGKCSPHSASGLYLFGCDA